MKYLILLLALFVLAAAPAPAPVYTQDFEKLAEGKPPEELLVLNGAFTIKKMEQNALLELAPFPLDSNGLLFGPSDLARGAVSARVWAAATGKRNPEFGIGALGAGGYRLWVMPAVSQLQILKGDEVVARAEYKWTSATWTRLKLTLSPADGGKLRLAGKAWPVGAAEPAADQVQFEDSQPPKPGRASLWATPYSGQPTRFDDLAIMP